MKSKPVYIVEGAFDASSEIILKYVVFMTVSSLIEDLLWIGCGLTETLIYVTS